eukprot:5313820-Prymnesium_polylepis.2
MHSSTLLRPEEVPGSEEDALAAAPAALERDSDVPPPGVRKRRQGTVPAWRSGLRVLSHSQNTVIALIAESFGGATPPAVAALLRRLDKR